MPRVRKSTAQLELGIVRLTGRAKTLRKRGPSGTLYVFERRELTEVLPKDWDWLETFNSGYSRLEIVSKPKVPEPVVTSSVEDQN